MSKIAWSRKQTAFPTKVAKPSGFTSPLHMFLCIAQLGVQLPECKALRRDEMSGDEMSGETGETGETGSEDSRQIAANSKQCQVCDLNDFNDFNHIP